MLWRLQSHRRGILVDGSPATSDSVEQRNSHRETAANIPE